MESLPEIKSRAQVAIPGASLEIVPNSSLSGQQSLLADNEHALAVALSARGITAGDRVAVYLQNVPQFVIAMLAAWKCGAVMVSVNAGMRTAGCAQEGYRVAGSSGG